MQLQSIKVLFVGYIAMILLGTFLLTLPPMFSSHVGFLDAFFTSVSAITCTGLIIKDTSLDFTLYGQIVILVLIQLGGFGYMTIVGILYIVIKKKLSTSEKNVINVVENLNNNSLSGIEKAVLNALFFVLLVEFVGALILSLYFCWKLNDIKMGIWAGIFHSIAAFNNSGFTIFNNSLIDYQADIFVNIVVALLVIIGGIGYVSTLEISRFFYSQLNHKVFRRDAFVARLSLNSRVVIVVNTLLVIFGMLNILIFEWNNPKTLANIPFWEKIINSFFTSICYRTAGYNIFDMSGFNDSTMFFSVFFMMIGGSPGGTASGIKVTTFAVLIALSVAIIKNRKETILFNRTISQEIVSKAFSVFAIAAIYLLVATFLLSIFEPDIRFLPLFFETSSAFATVGMSMGDGGVLSLCSKFDTIGLCIIMVLMLSGKIGVLSFTLIFVGGAKHRHIQYPQEKVLI
ncbi:TrkH family potassium uptake protein [Helicobacter muridarum]|uniref:K+ uptake protein n=1 Tax=Helicobacter muridarum TaxID=216 RepID=A0A099TW81_9HELI|nr:potassium transporter TrkG [Helicobacter muridarum]TLE00588.1 TrkH family potassium uptake protein [Helicobacter muridarum]STQ85602.1 K+ uptake protein [Helicobacter muridarum]